MSAVILPATGTDSFIVGGMRGPSENRSDSDRPLPVTMRDTWALLTRALAECNFSHHDGPLQRAAKPGHTLLRFVVLKQEGGVNMTTLIQD